MAFIFKEPFAVIGSKLSIGAFDQGYLTVTEPDVSLDVWGTARFRKGVDLTDSSTNWGGPSCRLGGNGSTVFGTRNSALGYNSLSQGSDNYALGNASVAIGTGLVAGGADQAAFGRYNVGDPVAQASAADVLLVVGDGRDAGNRADALRVYGNGTVYANALATTSGVRLLDPTFLGPLIETGGAEGARRGVSADAGSTSLYGPSVQLSLSDGLGLHPHVTLSNAGTVVQSDCTFYGNVSIVGQTYTTVTQTYTTVASSVECSDPVIVIGAGHPAQANGAPYDLGLVGERPGGNVALVWDESAGEWAAIRTQEGGAANQFSQFSYANLHVAGLAASDLTLAGNLALAGSLASSADLVTAGNLAASGLTARQDLQVARNAYLSQALQVGGPSVVNTLFVANQAYLNAGLLPSAPDSWPIGQVDNRFSRAFLDTIDVYDSLRLPGAAQDTFPARIGAFGEANVYLYTTSPAYADTVGIYFDKGQQQLPYGKSALVQRYDQWALRTMGTDRLTANTVTGNLCLCNDVAVFGNLLAYGPSTALLNQVTLAGALAGNTAAWSNSTSYGGDLLPTAPVAVGNPAARFTSGWFGTVDALRADRAGPVISAGGANVYLYSAPNVAVVLDVQGAPAGKGGLYQDSTSLQLLGLNRAVLTADTRSGDVAFAAGSTVAGNAVVAGQVATAQNMLVNPGFLAANAAAFAGPVAVCNVAPAAPGLYSLGAPGGRFRSVFAGTGDFSAPSDCPLRAGSAASTNVYLYTTTAFQSAGVTLDVVGVANSGLVQGPSAAAWWAAGQARLTLDNATGSLTAAVPDARFAGNAAVQGNAAVGSDLRVGGLTSGNAAFWANASTFAGPLLPGQAGVVLGSAAARFAQVAVQRLDAYDASCPVRAGGPGATNVFVFSDSTDPSLPVSLVMSKGAAPSGSSAMAQNLTSWSLSTAGRARVVADTLTGNVAFAGDVLVGGNLAALGQTVALAQDLTVQGRAAGNTAYWAGPTVYGGSLSPAAPNAVAIAAPTARFAAAFLNQANLHNQTGACQLTVGSSQSANVLVYTESLAAGQTACLSFGKGPGVSGAIGQDATRLFLRQGNQDCLTVSAATRDVAVAAGSTVGANLSVLGRAAVLGDASVSGQTSANTLTVANTCALLGNVLAGQAASLGNAAGRFAGAWLGGLDVYGTDPQARFAGPGAATVILAGQTAGLTLQAAGASTTIVQAGSGLALSTQGVPRVQLAAGGDVAVSNNLAVSGACAVAGGLTAAGNVGLQGPQARWPLDFNGYTGERTVALGNAGWLGSNAGELAYLAAGAHRFSTVAGGNVAVLGQSVVLFANLAPAAHLAWDVGSAGRAWRTVAAGNVVTLADSTLNGVVVGRLGGPPGTAGVASASQPANAFALAQQPGGNTCLNSAAGGCVTLATGNVVAAVLGPAGLRAGDSTIPTRSLEAAGDLGVGGTVYASQSSGFASAAALALANSGGWLRLGTVTLAAGGQLRLSLLGQANVGPVLGPGGESTVYVASGAAGNVVAGSWSCAGPNQLLSAVRLVQLAAGTYGVLAAQGGNAMVYSAKADLTLGSFSHACQAAADPGTGGNVTVLPQQAVLNGFSIYGNSVGVLNNAIGGQPWLFNGNSVVYANYPNIGVGTNYPVANLDVRGSFNFTGTLLSNGKPVAAAQFLVASNAYVSQAADPALYAANAGVAYPSSMRVGDASPPAGVLDLVQGNTSLRFGGAGRDVSDVTTTSNVMSFNVSGPTASWTFARQPAGGSKVTVATVTSDGSYVQSSDARLKHNVRDLDAGTLDKLQQLRVRQYQTGEEATRTSYGLIAQEVQEVLPELVHGHGSGYLAVNYTALVPLLLRAVQGLARR